jgi:opacity protein-like surface antigen
MAAWLDAATAALLAEVSGVAADAAWVGAVDAATEWVEDKRKDLFVGDPAVFTPGASVKLGTAMLAHRWYNRRVAPLGNTQPAEFGGGIEMLRSDPDIAKLLGIGPEGPFVFGAGATFVVVEATP